MEERFEVRTEGRTKTLHKVASDGSRKLLRAKEIYARGLQKGKSEFVVAIHLSTPHGTLGTR